MSITPGTVITLLHNIGSMIGFLNKASHTYKTRSLVDVTKMARVEPFTVISKDCLTLEYMPDILQTLLSLFAGYYLQAVSLSAKINNVKVAKILDSLNPDRDAYTAFSFETFREASSMSLEAYKFRLPRSYMPSLEESAAEKEKRLPDPVFSTDDTKVVTEVSNLAVGKVLNVSIDAGEEKFTIPVTIRLAAATIPVTSITHILALKTEDNTLVERFHAWRSGRIAFIRDLILCQDLIDEHKKALMKDDNGAYSEIIRRANNAKKYGLMKANPSLVSASNLFVISETAAREVEQKLGGKLSNHNIRNKAFENTYAMIIAVVDRDYERVTFYHRGIAQPTEVSVKDLKAANKKGGPDIMDFLKSYQLGIPAAM